MSLCRVAKNRKRAGSERLRSKPVPHITVTTIIDQTQFTWKT